MRILLVTEGTYPYVIGGVSTWCDQLIQSLNEHQFSILAVVGPNPQEPNYVQHDNIESLHVVPIWKAREDLLTANSDERKRFDLALDKFTDFLDGNLERVAQGLLELVELGDHFDLWHLFEREVVWQRLAKKLRPKLNYNPNLADLADCVNWLRSSIVPLLFTPPSTDLVHTVVNGLAALPAWVASKQQAVPLVLTEHGVYLRERYLGFSEERGSAALKFMRSALYKSVAKLIYLHADRILSVSEFNKKWQLEFGAPLERTSVISNGVDPELFPFSDQEIVSSSTASKQVGRPMARPTVVWVGRIDPLKDLATLIRAFRGVLSVIPNAQLKLFGPVPLGNEDYYGRLQDMIAAFKLSNHIKFEGPISPVYSAYAQADVVALSSASEGFPYTVVEAMMSGKAVVSTKAGGVEEALKDAGLLVPIQDDEGLAEAIILLLNNVDLRNVFALKARRRALEKFTLNAVTTAYRQVYQDAFKPLPSQEELILLADPESLDADTALLIQDEA